MMNRDFLILYELSKRMKSVDDRLTMSSSEFGNYLGISQQSASRHLKELENRGFIKRTLSGKGKEIRLTKKGISILNEIYVNLKVLIEGSTEFVVEGRVTTGIGEGAYYVKLYSDRIEELIGFKPFSGTLNIKPFSKSVNIGRYSMATIKGFKKEGRTFGDIKLISAKLLINEMRENCYIIMPQRAHHSEDIEIVSEFNLREKIGLKDGDIVGLEIY